MPKRYDQNKNLVEHIVLILMKANHPQPDFWVNQVHPDVYITPDVNIQRFLINRFWRNYIGQFQENTLEVRHCLIDQGSIEDWLRLFEQGVAPCVMRNIPLRTSS